MEYDYVQRCKSAVSNDLHDKVHLSIPPGVTLCGKELDWMWWVNNRATVTMEDVTCKTCLAKHKKRSK